MFQTALVAASLDERDRYVLDALVRLAPVAGLQRVLLVHVHSAPTYADPLLGGLPLDTATEAAPGGLAGIAKDLRGQLPEVQVEEMHPVGRPYHEIARLAEEQRVDWVLMGRLPVRDDQPTWGRHGLDILRHACRTTLVVPHGARLENDVALVGLDFSGASTRALRAALALRRRVHPIFVYASDPSVAAAGVDPEELARRLEENARRHYREEVLPQLGRDPSSMPDLQFVRNEDPEDGLLEHAPAGGMIVVGSRGLSPIASRLLGSVSEQVCGRSPVPVLAVRPRGRKIGVIGGLGARS